MSYVVVFLCWIITTVSDEMKPDLFFSLQAVLFMYLVYCDICHNDLSVKSLLRAWYYTNINFLKTGCWFVNVISLFSQATFTCVILYKYQLFKDGLLISKISPDLSIVHFFLWYYFVWSIFPYFGTVWRYQMGNQKQ
jgi:hypothetical protein